MTFADIAWLPLCAGLTAVGVVLAFLAFRRRGAAAGLRATAWALLPLAAYLTGVLETLWNMVASIVTFVTRLVLSPTVWAGVALAGLSVVLFLVSGVMRGRTLRMGRRSRNERKGSEPAPAAQPGRPADVTKPMARPVESKNDDFSDIEDILKKRGIS
ncbi:cellulose synthase [Herbidospora sp. NEAU-GS84]|uniref:Cellulose synthase n=1 Tax=Herbidospora solisilvae TaxID=2696284 RepID=A0A7C9J7R9_9ACTN|nr:cellulose synthase [Herbidospora solisilvae]NAS26180.1 cellulose synthase [Herbidospora solisilvae]